ncbi:MAG: hypothetical protein K1X61_03195 [Chitinophagales bacterium]|nr:hypothetical protein [Chitinophagales bacterium]
MDESERHFFGCNENRCGDYTGEQPLLLLEIKSTAGKKQTDTFSVAKTWFKGKEIIDVVSWSVGAKQNVLPMAWVWAMACSAS